MNLHLIKSGAEMPQPDYFDPRQQPVETTPTGPQPAGPCTTESAQRALRDLHKARVDVISGEAAKGNLADALRLLLSMYDGSTQAVLIYAVLADCYGPQTMYRYLLDVIQERVER